MEAITEKRKKEISVDELLFLIKEKHFKKEKIKKDLNIDIKIIKLYNKNSAKIELNGQKYDIKKESRMILFNDENKSTKRFIRSFYHLKEVIEELNFKAIMNPFSEESSRDSGDSLSSEINENYLLEIFKNESIIQITKDKTNLEKIIDKFKKRYCCEKKIISDLCLNSSVYYPDNKEDKVNFNLLQTFEYDLTKFFINDCNILYVVGPKGTSKSLFLMNYCYDINEDYKQPLLYINYRVLKESNNEKKKNIFKKEFIYLFFDEVLLNNFYNEKTYDSITKEKLIKFIYDYIVNLLNIYKTTFNKRIIVVIDNFDEDDKDNIEILNRLINTIKKEENRSKLKLIISGRCGFIYDKQLLYLKNELKIDKPIKWEMLLYYNTELNTINESNSSKISNESINSNESKGSNKYNGSNESNYSKKSNESNNSNESNGPNKPNGSKKSNESNNSNESNGPNKYNGSNESNYSKGSNNTDNSNQSNNSNEFNASNKSEDSNESNESNDSNDSNESYDSNESNEKNTETNDKINNMNSLPLFYYYKKDQYNNDEKKDILIKKEIEFCNKFNPYGMHYSILNEKKEIKLTELEKYYKILPLDYLVFTKISNNIVSFKFHNEIFKSASKKSIEFSIQSDNFKNILQSFGNDRIIQGIFEEKILILYLSYNKLDLKDLYFKEENRLEVEEIYKFQFNNFDKTNKSFDKNKPIIITQENYLGKNYDLLILIPMNDKSGYKAYFIQIGTNKTKAQIDLIFQDLNENKNNYKEGIKKYIGYDIISVELAFIFDKDTQIGLFKKQKISGAQYCIKNKYLFYIFSTIDFKLYKTCDIQIFTPINIFEDCKNSNKLKRNYNESKGDFSFLTIEEVKLVNGLIQNDILNNFIILNTIGYIDDLKNYKKNNIYIYYNNNTRIYIINKQYYLFEDGELKRITKKYINQKEKYQLKILSEINPSFKKNKPSKKTQ